MDLKSKPNRDDQKTSPMLKLKAKGDHHTMMLKPKDFSQNISINLNWQTNADLDLGCFYQLRSPVAKGGFFARLLDDSKGHRGVIDGLQFSHGQGGPRDRVTAQGCYTQRPFIWHTGDDRSGAATAEGESILINPAGCEQLERMTIYAFIYEGAAHWNQTDAVISVKASGNPAVIVEMGRQKSNCSFTAIASLDFMANDQVRITKLVSFHDGHADCDRAYKWGMSWHEGNK